MANFMLCDFLPQERKIKQNFKFPSEIKEKKRIKTLHKQLVILFYVYEMYMGVIYMCFYFIRKSNNDNYLKVKILANREKS